MAVNYLPLRKMEELEECIDILDKNIEILYRYNFPKVKNYDEYIELIMKLYMHELDENSFYRIMKSIIVAHGQTLEEFGVVDNSDTSNSLVKINEILDYIFMPYALNIWRINKQVYKPDGDFCNALLKTENLTLTKDMLIHLPCKHFYIDLSDCDIFLPIKGIFVNVFIYEDCNKIALSSFLLDNDLVTWSSYDVLNFDEEKEIKISQKYMVELSNGANGDYIQSDFRLLNETSDCVFVEQIIENKSNNQEGQLNRYETSFFVYQLLTYMVSHEPQIEENSITKSTYRPPKNQNVIKNKFSEIQMHDIGVRFGKKFKEQKKKYKCNTFLTKHLEHQRKSPIPHFRCAHWQGYWVGRGRTEHIVKWIEPTFVGGEDSNDVVIHKI